MPREPIEIKEIVEETERSVGGVGGFPRMRERARERRAQLYKQDSYAESLEASLAKPITVRIARMSDVPGHTAGQIQGIINSSLSFHVESANDRRADRQELFYANLWGSHLNKGNRLMNDIQRHQVVSPFAAVWLDYNQFDLPKDDADAAKKYRDAYEPWSVSVIDPLSVAFPVGEEDNPSLATRHFEMGLIEIARRYGIPQGDDDNPLTILGTQFDWLRAGKGVSADFTNIVGKKAKVYEVDDGNVIGHWTEIDGVYRRLNNQDESPETADIPNPWGRSSLFLVHGILNDDSPDPVDRYLPLNAHLMGAQRTMDVVETHIASIAFTPSKFGVVLPADAAAAATLGDTAIAQSNLGDDTLTNLLGRLEEAQMRLDSNVWSFREGAVLERDSVKPPAFLTSPDPADTKGVPATGQLAAIETSDRVYDAARASKVKFVVDVSNAIKHFISGGHEPFEGEEIKFRIAGTEQVTARSGTSVASRKNEEIIVTYADFEKDDPLEVSIVASTDAQKALRYQVKQMQFMDHTATKRDLVAETTNDVTGKEAELNEEALFQEGSPAILKGALLMAVQLIQAETGEDLSPLFMQGDVPGAPGGGGSEPAPTGNAPLNQNHVAPPATSQSDIGATG